VFSVTSNADHFDLMASEGVLRQVEELVAEARAATRR
jgi:hypothetical protein